MQPLRIAAIGLAAATLLAGGGMLVEQHVLSSVDAAQARCLSAASHSLEPPLPVGFVLDCNLNSLLADAQRSPPVGLQGALVQAHLDSRSRQRLLLSVAGLVLLVSLLPAIWYFLLSRVAELASAIAGKR
jgi:hypothetical protein